MGRKGGEFKRAMRASLLQREVIGSLKKLARGRKGNRQGERRCPMSSRESRKERKFSRISDQGRSSELKKEENGRDAQLSISLREQWKSGKFERRKGRKKRKHEVIKQDLKSNDVQENSQKGS